MKSDTSVEVLTLKFRQFLENKIITESIKQLMSSHDIPKSFAKHVKSKCSKKNSDFIVKIFLKNYKSMIENMTSESAKDREKMLSDNYINEFNRFMGYVGETLDEYLKKHNNKKSKQELLELCEQGWPKFLKKMREYKKEHLNEVRLNKTWRKRVKERAKRHGRDISPEDKKWAKKRLQDWNKESEELEEAYLNEIEAAMEASKASKLYLEKLRALRKQKLEAKKTGMVNPNEKPKTTPKRPPPLKKRKHNRIPSSPEMPSVAPGAAFGGISEEENKDEQR